MTKLQKTETGARVFTTTVADDNSHVVFTFGNERLTVNVADYSPAIAARLTCHGIVQKIGDSKTGAKRDDYDTIGDWHAAQWAQLNATAEMVANGDWSKRGDGEATGGVSGIIYRAFCVYMREVAADKNVAAPTDEKLRAVYDARDRAGQLALRKIPRVAAIMDELRTKTAPAVDTDALFAELM